MCPHLLEASAKRWKALAGGGGSAEREANGVPRVEGRGRNSRKKREELGEGRWKIRESCFWRGQKMPSERARGAGRGSNKLQVVSCR